MSKRTPSLKPISNSARNPAGPVPAAKLRDQVKDPLRTAEAAASHRAFAIGLWVRPSLEEQMTHRITWTLVRCKEMGKNIPQRKQAGK